MKKCIYCGATENITREHTPQKSLFEKPRPSNLITVPSCLECNNRKSKENEYLKFIFNITYNKYKTGNMKNSFDAVIRGVLREEKSKFLKKFIENSSLIQYHNHVEDSTSNISVFKPNSYMIESSVKDTAIGLLFHHSGKYCYSEYKIDVWWLNYQYSEEWKRTISWVLNQPKNTIKEDVFWYKYYTLFNDRFTAWYLCFYEFFKFVVFIEDKSLRDSNHGHPE